MDSLTFYTTTDVNDSLANVTPAVTQGQRALQAPEGCFVLAVKRGSFVPWDNPDNLISRSTERAVDSAVALVFLPLLFLVSVPTNIINMLVYWKQGLQERIHLCLFSLSFVDLVFMLYSGLYNVDRFYLLFTKPSKFGPVLEFIISHGLGSFRGLSWVSGSITTLISCERCFCVISPLRSQTWLKTRTTAVLILVPSAAILAVLHISTTRWSISCVYDPATNSTSKSMYSSQFYRENKVLVDVITGVMVCLVLPLFFVSVVLTTTVVTIVKLRHVVRWREQTSSGAMTSREVALTRMLVAISVLYVLCTLPALVTGVCLLTVPDISLHGRHYNTFNLLITLIQLCSYINASSNFSFYCRMSSKYRDTLRELFRCPGQGKSILPADKGKRTT